VHPATAAVVGCTADAKRRYDPTTTVPFIVGWMAQKYE
jgi:hypothetical protein